MQKIPLVRPFRALRPRPDCAADVIAPPYDVVDTEEARALAAGRPRSFLHISRPEIDFPPGTDAKSDAVYERGAANLERLRSEGVLERESDASYYIYRMTMGDHSQTGVALIASTRAYESNAIRRHELTRPDKENDRVRNIEALDAETGPVLLAYRAEARLDALIAERSRTAPDLQAEGQHGVRHAIWRVGLPDAVAELGAALNALHALYIADGHHRSAAAARVARARRQPETPPSASQEYFLAVAFPHDQMRIFDYNRVVADLNGLGTEAFLAAVGERFELGEAAGEPRPEAPGHFGMYLAGRWYHLEAKAPAASGDPVAALDVSRLQSGLIEPVLGIADPRTDERIDFVGGVRGLAALAERVDSGRAAVAFALYPTRMEQLMAVADANELMPPKSTWFEPKLADGLLTHVLD